MSNALNTFFASVFTMENLDNFPYAEPIQVDDASTHVNIDIIEEQVLNCLYKLNVNKTPGPDAYSLRMLKEAKDEFLKPLTSLSISRCKQELCQMNGNSLT